MKLLLLALLLTPTLPAQTSLWGHVVPTIALFHAPLATLNVSQMQSIERLFLNHPRNSSSECPEKSGTTLFSALTYTRLGPNILLAEDLEGCGTSGTGGGRAMWVIQLLPHRALFLAISSPVFDGWLYQVVPAGRPTHPDFILGWHMSAAETDLTYYRFDGRYYRVVSTAKLVNNGDSAIITPN